LAALIRVCYLSAAEGEIDLRTYRAFHVLTGFLRIDTLLWKGARCENRGVDRILRGLKLHAEGRQFGDQNS
jgi:hypothetical protein